MNAEGRRRLSRGSAAAGLWLAATASGASAQTLVEALTGAYRNSPALAAERAVLRGVDEQVPQALAYTRPQVSLNATDGSVREESNGPVEPVTGATGIGNGYFPTNLPQTSYGVTITQQLYRGGQTLAQYRAAKASVASERYKLMDTEAQTLLKAVSDYADVAQARDSLALSDKQVATSTSDEAQAQARYIGGDMTRTDLAQSQAAKVEAIGERTQAQIGLEQARAAFARDTGLPAGDIVLPSPDAYLAAFSQDEAMSLAVAAAPSVKAAALAVEAARQKVRLAQGQALPNVSLQGVYEHQEGQSFRGQKDDLEALIVQFRQPIYSGGSLASQTRASRATYEQQRALLDSAQQAAAYAASNAWVQLKSAEAAAVAYETQAKINETALTGLRLEASTGERTLQDVLVAELTLLQSQEKLAQARHDAFVARFTLLAVVGRLQARELHLPGPYYDPEDNYRRVHLGPGR